MELINVKLSTILECVYSHRVLFYNALSLRPNISVIVAKINHFKIVKVLIRIT